MSKVLDVVVDPFNLFNNFGLNLGKDKKSGSSAASDKNEGVMSDKEASELARKRMFLSGTIYTSTL